MPGLQELRQQFAQKAVTHYVIYRARRPDDLAVIEGHARSLTVLGTIMGQVGSVDEAVKTLTRAIQIREGLVAKQPAGQEYQFTLAQSRFELGYLYWLVGQFPLAQPHLSGRRRTGKTDRQGALECEVSRGPRPN